jgi:hypothetical protein
VTNRTTIRNSTQFTQLERVLQFRLRNQLHNRTLSKSARSQRRKYQLSETVEMVKCATHSLRGNKTTHRPTKRMSQQQMEMQRMRDVISSTETLDRNTFIAVIRFVIFTSDICPSDIRNELPELIELQNDHISCSA